MKLILPLPLTVVAALISIAAHGAEQASAGSQPADAPVTERLLNRAVSDFAEPADVSAPEGACAAWQRATATTNAEALASMSLAPLNAAGEAAWFERERSRDPEGLSAYLAAVGKSTVVCVLAWREDLACVVTLLPFPEGKGRDPYSARYFGRVNGVWKNLGEDRLPTLDAAKAGFDRKKSVLLARYEELKSTAALVERLNAAEPLMDSIRAAWADAAGSIQSGDMANAKTALRDLEPKVREFQDRTKDTPLSPGIEKALGLIHTIQSALDKGDGTAAQEGVDRLNELGQTLEGRIREIQGR